jgi:tRNA intron endonuclease, catalytic C-terminal domain
VKHGYFVGPGDVYGGDYTIYRGGDPSNSHSTATVRVVRQRKVRIKIHGHTEVPQLVNLLIILLLSNILFQVFPSNLVQFVLFFSVVDIRKRFAFLFTSSKSGKYTEKNSNSRNRG